jgi:hypothetical protein
VPATHGDHRGNDQRDLVRPGSGCGVSGLAMRPRLLSDGALYSLRSARGPDAGQHSIRHGPRKVNAMSVTMFDVRVGNRDEAIVACRNSPMAP